MDLVVKERLYPENLDSVRMIIFVSWPMSTVIFGHRRELGQENSIHHGDTEGTEKKGPLTSANLFITQAKISAD